MLSIDSSPALAPPAGGDVRPGVPTTPSSNPPEGVVVQQENRRFTTLSNILRAKHDTAKAALANIRA